MRPAWESLPLPVKDAVESILGFSVVRSDSQRGGFSPGVAARVWGPAGEAGFVKAVSSEANPHTPDLHRAEARFAALLPADHPSPALLGCVDLEPWVALAFEQVDGHEPGRPWTEADLDAVVRAVDAQALVPAPPELPAAAERLGAELQGWRRLQTSSEPLTPWEDRHLAALAEIEATWEAAAAGDRWLHLDVRGDNLLVRRDGRAVLVDWPWSAAGNPVFDALAFVPAAVRDGAVGGKPGAACEQLFQRFAAARAASEADVTALLVAFAGLMQHQHRQPPPPGLPTVREFQRSQGAVALAWLQLRTGWS
jgi:aminoglycoside phosphotransferase (APT) family kinase protein